MPNKIQKIFVCGDKLISYRYHKGVFEAHYRRNGLNIYASSKDFQEMRRKFLILLANAEPTSQNIPSHEYLSPSIRGIPFYLWITYNNGLTVKKLR